MRGHRIYGPGPGEPEPLRPVPDMGGIPADDVEGRPAGVLRGALADAESGLIRYLDLELEGDRRHVLVPLGHARLERDRIGRPRIHLLAATRRDLRSVPEYSPGEPTVGEAQGRRAARAHGRLFRGERYYAHPAYDHRGLYAGEHPILRGPAAPRPLSPLVPLSALPDFEIARGEPDIRRWPLHAGRRRAGTIDDLVVDPAAGKVRYAIVGIEKEGRQVLLPVGYLRIRPGTRIVEAPALTEDDLRALPSFRPGRITRAFEQRVRTTLADRLDHDGRHFLSPDYGPPTRDARAA